MRLTQEEIRSNAARFAAKWSLEKGDENAETQSFWNELFEVFGRRRDSVARYEAKVIPLNEKNKKRMDLFWPGKLLVEQKSKTKGDSLDKAEEQAKRYLTGIAEEEKPRYYIVCDFANFRIVDLEEDKATAFVLSELPKHVGLFDFMWNREEDSSKQAPVDYDKVDEFIRKLHASLIDGHYSEEETSRFLMMVVYCLFAEDTGIFEPSSFLHYVEDSSPASLGGRLRDLFEILGEDYDDRSPNTPDELKNFRPIGGIFKQGLKTPKFTQDMHENLVKAASYNWKRVSPAIFGSMFESVMNPEQRRNTGAHYTPEEDIKKVINPLFIDDLRTELRNAKKRGGIDQWNALVKLHGKLERLRIFDPACGCGNFLVVAYKEIRQLELEVVAAILRHPHASKWQKAYSVVDVHQFYGIEINEFAVRIAEVALHMMDHIMNVKLELYTDKQVERLPIKREPNIAHADALTADWEMLLHPSECSYIVGNPPFLGCKSPKTRFTPKMKANLAKAFGRKDAGMLDFVTAWFAKAANYTKNHNVPFAFVATNSICQGTQVEQLWTYLLEDNDLEIAFAYKSFPWPGLANVHVVIAGLEKKGHSRQPKLLFDGNTVTQCSEISPYLEKGPWLRVAKASKPLFGQPKVEQGTVLVADSFVLDPSEKDHLINKYPQLASFVRPWFSGTDLLNGVERYLLLLTDAPSAILKLPEIKVRIAEVKKQRADSDSAQVSETANTPTKPYSTRIPKGTFLAIPATSSERRTYLPFAYLTAPTMVSHGAYFSDKATIADFALLQNRAHTIWAKTFAGKLKGDIRYINTFCYNTFPFPVLTKDQEKELTKLGQAILDARDPKLTLAEQYDPDTMSTVNPALYKAHKANDKYVLKLYGLNATATDEEILEKLYKEYTTRKPK